MTVTFDTQAQWAAGPTQLNCDTSTVPNHLKADFSSTAAKTNSNWIQTSEMSNWSVDSRTSVAMGGVGTAYMVMSGDQTNGGLQTWRSNVTGSGRWDAEALINGASGVWTFIFMAQDVNASTLFPKNTLPGNTTTEYYALYHGYCLRVDSTQGFPTNIRVQLQRMDNNAVNNTTIGSGSYTNSGAADHVFTIVRYPTGLFKVFMDGSGSPLITATDTTYTTGNYLGFASYQNQFAAKNTTNLLKPSTSFQMAWESTSIDTSGDLNLWKNRFYVYGNSNNVLQLNSTSAFTLQTRCGTTSGSMDLFSTVANRPNQSPGVSGSGQLQFMRAQILFNTITQANNEDPDVTKLVVGFPLKNTAFLA